MTDKRGVLGIETGPPREQKRTAEAVGPQRQDGARGSGPRAGLLGVPGVSSRGFTPGVLAPNAFLRDTNHTSAARHVRLGGKV